MPPPKQHHPIPFNFIFHANDRVEFLFILLRRDGGRLGGKWQIIYFLPQKANTWRIKPTFSATVHGTAVSSQRLMNFGYHYQFSTSQKRPPIITEMIAGTSHRRWEGKNFEFLFHDSTPFLLSCFTSCSAVLSIHFVCRL